MKTQLRVLLALALLAACGPAIAQSTTTISALPAATTPLTGQELLPLVQSGATKKITAAALTVAFQGASAPTLPIAGQLWFNTTTTSWVLSQYDGAQWVTIGTLNTTAHIWTPASGGGGAVSSVFGRTGAVVAATNDYTFAQIGSTPTTLAGYGISDGVSLTGTQTLTNKTLTGPIMTAPVLGTPASGTLTNATGYLASNLSGLGTGVGTALGAAVSGSGSICLSTGSSCAPPTAANPTATIGAAAVNGVATTFMRSDAAPPLPSTLPALNGSLLTSMTVSQISGAAPLASPTFTGTVTIPNGGVFGTPTSLTLTNAVGLPLTTGVTGILPAANGGNGNGFFAVSGPATTTKTFTFPNASANVLTDNAAVTVAQGGTGIASGTSGGVPYYSGTTSIASSALLTNHAIMLGGGAAAAPKVVASLGTSTTLLHGAAAGDPTFSAVDLNADVTGNLGVSHLNSGTAASSSTFWRGDGTWATPAGAGTVTSVAQSFTGGLISVSGSPITGAGTLALTVAGTSGGIPYFSSASTWASSAALAANAIVIGGGAGVAPSTTTTGTGILTLLGTPTSANLAAALTDETGTGAAVFANGPTLVAPILGTPASGNASNLTNIPVANATGILPAANGGAGTVSGLLQANGSGLVAAATLGNGLMYSSPKLSLTNTLNAQTGTTYALATTDAGAIVTGVNASAQAYSIVQATTTGFTTGYGTTLANIGTLGSSGNITLTAATSLFGNKLSALIVSPGQVANIGSNSADYPFTEMSLPVVVAGGFLGNNTGTNNYPTSLTATQATAMLNNFTSTLAGLAPLSGGGTTNFLRADGTWAAPAGGSGCTVSGTAGQAVYNSGSSGCLSSAATFSSGGGLTLPLAGAASTPGLTVSGAPFTGGTATTNFPQIYASVTGATAPTTLSAAGTFFGANSGTGFTGNFLDFHVNGGASVFKVASTGAITAGGITATGLDISGASSQNINMNANSSIQVAGGSAFGFFGSQIFFGQDMLVSTGAKIPFVTVSGTVPSIIMNSSSSNTGWGAQAATNISGIIVGVEKTRLTAEGLQYKQATAPVITGTGSPTIATGGTDESGLVTAGTSATSVIITFNLTHASTPFCVVNSLTQLSAFSYTLSNTAITITQTSTSGNKIAYRCTFP